LKEQNVALQRGDTAEPKGVAPVAQRAAADAGTAGAGCCDGVKKFAQVKVLNQMERKRVMITGGAGFVGSHLVDVLMKQGHEVTVVDNFFTGRRRNVEHWIGQSARNQLPTWLLPPSVFVCAHAPTSCCVGTLVGSTAVAPLAVSAHWLGGCCVGTLVGRMLCWHIGWEDGSPPPPPPPPTAPPTSTPQRHVGSHHGAHGALYCKLAGHTNFELITHDVVESIMLEVDEIYHLASPASPPHYMYNPIKTIKTNTIGTINMLGLARRIGARVLLASTSEVYGDPEVHPQVETYRGNVNPIGPRACYDEGRC
jgi:hypothetical protein